MPLSVFPAMRPPLAASSHHHYLKQYLPLVTPYNNGIITVCTECVQGYKYSIDALNSDGILAECSHANQAQKHVLVASGPSLSSIPTEYIALLAENSVAQADLV